MHVLSPLRLCRLRASRRCASTGLPLVWALAAALASEACDGIPPLKTKHGRRRSHPKNKTTHKAFQKRSLQNSFGLHKRSPTMAPAKKKAAAKPPATGDTTSVQPNDYEDDRAQRVAQNVQLLGSLGLEGGMIERPAPESRKRCEPMRRGALLGFLVRVSTAGMCRKTLAAPTTTEPARRSSRRTTACSCIASVIDPPP